MKEQKYKLFAIILSFILCTNTCAGASINGINSNENVAIRQDNLMVQDILRIVSLLYNIPLIGSLLASIPALFINYIVRFENLTNNFLDKILRNSLPCTITVNDIVCEGISKNGGLISIMKHAIDTMPSTRLFNIIKQVLDLITLAFEVPSLQQY
ncbi:uncharacterized protein LOC118442982 [Vespa mandarinia]|uniref:uncharacterized protein LOC118442982 n=1 Tax=Vespa mandarinia TaxID=7446 RepID=UPI00160EDB2B|nr:uncharacterized protein LOC118442982 [Vespa mandarinia]